MSVFRFMYLSIRTDKLTLSDASHTGDDDRGIILHHSMKFVKLCITTAEVITGSDVFAVSKQGITDKGNIACISQGNIAGTAVLILPCDGDVHCFIDHIHKRGIIAILR